MHFYAGLRSCTRVFPLALVSFPHCPLLRETSPLFGRSPDRSVRSASPEKSPAKLRPVTWEDEHDTLVANVATVHPPHGPKRWCDATRMQMDSLHWGRQPEEREPAECAPLRPMRREEPPQDVWVRARCGQ